MPTQADFNELLARVAALEERLGKPNADLPANALGVLRVVLRVLRRGGKWKPADRSDALTRGASLDVILDDLRNDTAHERDQKRLLP